MIDISIIVATYNSSALSTLRTLQSCISQQGVEIQIIVADDGSLQNNFEIIDLFFEHRDFSDYLLIDSETNRGTVENIRNAMKFVKANYVKTISPGDYFYGVGTLCKMVELLSSEDSSFCFGRVVCYDADDYHIITNKQMPKVMSPYCNENGAINIKLAKRNQIRYRDSIFGVSLMYRVGDFSDALDILSGNVRLCEDYSVRLLIADGRNYSFLDEYVVWYEYGAGVSTKEVKTELDPLFSDWYALSSILYEYYPDDPDVVALKEDLRLKTCSLLSPLKIILRSIKDPGRVRFFVESRRDLLHCKVNDYNLSSLYQQIDDDEIEALLLECRT